MKYVYEVRTMWDVNSKLFSSWVKASNFLNSIGYQYRNFAQDNDRVYKGYAVFTPEDDNSVIACVHKTPIL